MSGSQGRALSAAATNTHEVSIVCTCAAIVGNGGGVGCACFAWGCGGGGSGAVFGTVGTGETALPFDSAGFGAWRLALTRGAGVSRARFGARPLALNPSACSAAAAVCGGGGTARAGANDRRKMMPCPMVTKAMRATKNIMCAANRCYRSLSST